MSYDTYTGNRRDEYSREAERSFTEAQFYRTLSQLYDRTEERKAYKNLRTTAITLVTNGATHIIAALSSSFPEVDAATSKMIKTVYAGAAISALMIGIVLLIIYNTISKRCATKEALIREFIERDFGVSSSSDEALDEFY